MCIYFWTGNVKSIMPHNKLMAKRTKRKTMYGLSWSSIFRQVRFREILIFFTFNANTNHSYTENKSTLLYCTYIIDIMLTYQHILTSDMICNLKNYHKIQGNIICNKCMFIKLAFALIMAGKHVLANKKSLNAICVTYQNNALNTAWVKHTLM